MLISVFWKIKEDYLGSSTLVTQTSALVKTAEQLA